MDHGCPFVGGWGGLRFRANVFFEIAGVVSDTFPCSGLLCSIRCLLVFRFFSSQLYLTLFTPHNTTPEYENPLHGSSFQQTDLSWHALESSPGFCLLAHPPPSTAAGVVVVFVQLSTRERPGVGESSPQAKIAPHPRLPLVFCLSLVISGSGMCEHSPVAPDAGVSLFEMLKKTKRVALIASSDVLVSGRGRCPKQFFCLFY